jgi:hypothetical protein
MVAVYSIPIIEHAEHRRATETTFLSMFQRHKASTNIITFGEPSIVVRFHHSTSKHVGVEQRHQSFGWAPHWFAPIHTDQIEVAPLQHLSGVQRFSFDFGHSACELPIGQHRHLNGANVNINAGFQYGPFWLGVRIVFVSSFVLPHPHSTPNSMQCQPDLKSFFRLTLEQWEVFWK